MKNKDLIHNMNVSNVRTIEEVASRTLALGFFLNRVSVEWGLEDASSEEGTKAKYHSPGKVGNWLFKTHLIESLQPSEIFSLAQPLGSFGMWECLRLFEMGYKKLGVLLWAQSCYDEIPIAPFCVWDDNLELGNVGFPISSFLSLIHLRDTCEIRAALDANRRELLDCASDDPRLMQVLALCGYRIPWRSKIRQFGQYGIRRLKRESCDCPSPEEHYVTPLDKRTNSFLNALEKYHVLAWILDDQRDWDCTKVV